MCFDSIGFDGALALIHIKWLVCSSYNRQEQLTSATVDFLASAGKDCFEFARQISSDSFLKIAISSGDCVGYCFSTVLLFGDRSS